MDKSIIKQLRDALKDYYGTAMQYHPNAMGDLANVDSMSDDEVLKEAEELHMIEIEEEEEER